MEATKKEHQLLVSVSPHVKSEETTSRIMWSVSIALLPAFLAGVYFFGPRAVFITALCIISCAVCENLYLRIVDKQSTVSDGSAVLTGLLLGMNMPVSLWSFSPFTAHVPVIASFVAVVITKQLFGGLGFN
nr:RnfABCDGE type electron transport complex subunit D [Nitrospiraceae bacterium]